MQGKKITDPSGVVTKVNEKTGEVLEITFPLAVKMRDGFMLFYPNSVSVGRTITGRIILTDEAKGINVAEFERGTVSAIFRNYIKCPWLSKWAKHEKRYTTKGEMKCSTQRS